MQNARSVLTNKNVMKRLRKIKVIESEAGVLIAPEDIVEIEGLFADILFEAWLKDKINCTESRIISPKKLTS